MKNCILCQSNKAVSLREKHGIYDILYCSDCQLRFSDPMLHPGQIWYEESIYEDRSFNPYLQLPLESEWRYDQALKLIPFSPGARLLDIGCGEGAFLSLAMNRGFQVFGVDIHRRAIHFAQKIRKIDHVIQGSWEQSHKLIGWGAFDIVTMFEFVEHVDSPLSLLDHVKKLLKPGGAVCITVPREDRWPPLFDPVVDFPPHHLTLWTSKALKVLFNKAGIKVDCILEKPLLKEDFLCHLNWRIMRLSRKSENYLNTKEDFIDVKLLPTEFIVSLSKSKVLQYPLKEVIRAMAQLLRITHLGIGHTLLAMGESSIK